MNKYVIGFVVLLVILLIYHIWLYNKWYSSIVSGMWEATESFCTESELDGMHLMIGDSSSGKYKSCLIMTADNTIVLDETFDITFGWSLPATTHKMSIYLDIDSELIPEKLTCDVDFTKGIMTWYEEEDDEKKEYAIFRKMFVG